MKLHVLRTIASRTATAAGAAVIAAVVVAGSLSVAQAATEAIAPNSITSGMIRDGAVKSVDIKDGAITGTDLTDNSVAGADIQNGSIGSSDIGNGAVGGSQIADGSITSADVDASVGQPRVSVFVDGEATVGQFTTARATGVESVTNPNSGLFCITPVAGVDVDAVVPIVSLEWNGTASDNAKVAWSTVRYECPDTSIAVYGWQPSLADNNVAFTVVIP